MKLCLHHSDVDLEVAEPDAPPGPPPTEFLDMPALAKPVDGQVRCMRVCVCLRRILTTKVATLISVPRHKIGHSQY